MTQRDDSDEGPALHRQRVRPEWVDYNGHMNVAYYILVFDQATDAVLAHIGLDAAHRLATNRSVFVAEAHATFEQEVGAGEMVAVVSRILASDARRLILYHEMIRDADGTLLASNEVLCLYVDLASRRSVAFPADIAARLGAGEGDATRRPARAGRAVSLGARRPR